MDERLRAILLDWRMIAIMRHLKRANVDYGKSIMKDTGIPLGSVVQLLEQLEKLGLVNRIDKPVLKNTYAKFKRKHEVRKHHIYYGLSRNGELILRELDKSLPNLYVELILSDAELSMIWSRFINGSSTSSDLSILQGMGLIDDDGDLTEMGKMVRDRLIQHHDFKQPRQ
ncbi:MAG: DUF2250 domain-containing protein [Thermocladium sp.]